MRSTNALSLGLCLSNVFVIARSEDSDSSFSSDCSFGLKKIKCSPKNKKSLDFVTPFINGGGLPVALFSETKAAKFTELTYRTIKSLVLPRIDFFGPIPFGSKKMENKNSTMESEIYSLLLHTISTINPIAFDAYHNAFYSGKFYECFLILQRLYSVDSELERLIMSNILFSNRKIRRDEINSIFFIDVLSKDVFCIELPVLRAEKRIPFSLPRQILKFEEMVLFSFDLDEAIMADLEYYCSVGLKPIYLKLVKRFYKLFPKLSTEQRILHFLRIKFFVFNSCGLTISFLTSSGPKQNILELLLRTAHAENDAFFRSYAFALGLLTK